MRLAQILLCLILWHGFQRHDVTAESDQSCMYHELEEKCSEYAYQIVKPMMTYFDQVNKESVKNDAEMESMSKEIKQLHEKVTKLQIENTMYKTKEDSMTLVLEELKNQKTEILQQCQCEGKNNQIKKLAEQITLDAKRIKEYELNLHSKVEVIHEKEGRILQLEAENQNQTIKLTEFESMNEQKNGEIIELKANISLGVDKANQCDTEYKNQIAINIAHEQKINEMEAQITLDATRIKEYELNLHSKVEVIHEKEGRILQLEAENQNQTIKLTEFESMNEQKNGEIIELKANISLGVDKANQCDREYKNQKAINIANEQKIREMEAQVNISNEKFKAMETSRIDMSCIASAYTFKGQCNSEIAGPGWTVIQQRINGKVNFTRNWNEYKNGFGDFWDGDFFLGLEKIHRITSEQPHELYIHMENFDGSTQFARYDEFAISGEEDKYRLSKLGEFSGVSDKLRNNKDMRFTTYDSDNDNLVGNCANEYHDGTGWWYRYCTNSNLNGKYFETKVRDDRSIQWGTHRILKHVKMMIRPKDFKRNN